MYMYIRNEMGQRIKYKGQLCEGDCVYMEGRDDTSLGLVVVEIEDSKAALLADNNINVTAVFTKDKGWHQRVLRAGYYIWDDIYTDEYDYSDSGITLVNNTSIIEDITGRRYRVQA